MTYLRNFPPLVQIYNAFLLQGTVIETTEALHSASHWCWTSLLVSDCPSLGHGLFNKLFGTILGPGAHGSLWNFLYFLFSCTCFVEASKPMGCMQFFFWGKRIFTLNIFRGPTSFHFLAFTGWGFETLGLKTANLEKKHDWQINFSTTLHCEIFVSFFFVFELPFDRYLV